MGATKEKTRALISLSHELGAENRHLAILGEGNASAKVDGDTFLVKASGSTLRTLAKQEVVGCRFAPLLAMLDHGGDLSDAQIEAELLRSRVDVDARKPSVEALFHAYLLTLPGIGFVGHVHSVAVNQILCSPRARDFAEHRIFPDEIVCCGVASALIPYADPGLKLAQGIRGETRRFVERHGVTPRVILLENHGIIALGGSASAVTAALLMADKAARIFTGAAALGGPVFLDPGQVRRIADRADEHYRQRVLKL